MMGQVVFTRGMNARIASYIRIFFSFPYIYLYMYNMRCSPRGEERRVLTYLVPSSSERIR